MSTKDTATDPDLMAALEAANRAAREAELSPEEEAQARALAQIEEANTARREAERKRRGIKGAELERKARVEAAGRYSVSYFDLGALLPDAPADTLPGNGILVVRSHPPPAKKAFDSSVEAKDRPLSDAFIDLVCASTLHPKLEAETGLRFRAFLESDLGNGTATQIGAKILELGGARTAEAKRATR